MCAHTARSAMLRACTRTWRRRSGFRRGGRECAFDGWRHDTWHATGGVRADYDRRDWLLWRRRWTTACSNVDEMIDYANSLRNAKHPSEKRLYLLLAAKVPDLQVSTPSPRAVHCARLWCNVLCAEQQRVPAAPALGGVTVGPSACAGAV